MIFMKWLIRGGGMLTALFAVFFFLLVADKLYYQNSTDVEAHHDKRTVHIQQKGGENGAL